MGRFAVGQVVSSAIPFSDLSDRKYRPALIVALADLDDLVLCQITSKAYVSTKAIELTIADFATGGLPITSYIRPDKLFTAEPSIISQVYGELSPKKLQQVHAALRGLFAVAT